MTSQGWASDLFPVDRQTFPYYPSLLQYPPPQAEFTPPEVCAECHSRQYEEWTSSVHALAFVDPVYQGELNHAVKAVGHDISRQCEGCHSPAGVVTGEIRGAGLNGLSQMALAGVSCDICHSVTAVTHCQTPSREPENGSMVVTPGVARGDQIVLQKYGPNPTTELCGMEFHECAESPLHLRADLCASCHQVYHYETHFPLEATYLEWKHGPYAQREILCQDCHMVDIETFRRSADRFIKPERHEYRHYFNGANFLLYFLAAQNYTQTGDQQRAENAMDKFRMAVERLQAAAGLEVMPVYRNRQLSELKVRVKNLRAGHNLPTSLTNVRQMWVELTATDATGQVLVSSGHLDPKGELEPETRNLNSEGMGDNFHFAIDPWVVTAFSRHDTIPPKGYKEIYFGLLPVVSKGEVQVSVRLRYRQASQKVAEKLLGAVPDDIDLEKTYGLSAVPELPVVDMAQVATSFPAMEGD
ncbi:MAG: cytochrome C [Desulfuromonas sp.]|nr:MAG: cytochrome C [Desulfuromonas sp.]